MKVGIFDSGIGGLSVLHYALKKMPHTEFVYYADEKHVPYGEKSRSQIQTFVSEIIEFMLEQKVDAIVIACNTATSVATKEYRSQFPVPIIGMEPAVKKAVDLYGQEEGRILVAATPVTITGDKLRGLVSKMPQKDKIDLVALPQLVHFAENEDFQTEEIADYLKEELAKYPIEDYGVLVLGCTHFNYFKKSYREVFPEGLHFVDGNEGTVRQLLRMLPEDGKPSEQKVDYYISGNKATKEEEEKIQRYLKQLDLMYNF